MLLLQKELFPLIFGKFSSSVWYYLLYLCAGKKRNCSTRKKINKNMSYGLLCACLSKTALFSPCSLEGVMWSFPHFLMSLSQGLCGPLILSSWQQMKVVSTFTHRTLQEVQELTFASFIALEACYNLSQAHSETMKFPLYVPLHILFTSLFIICQKLFYGTQV